MIISKKYKKKLTEYIQWDHGDGMGEYKLDQDPNGMSADECMFQWESCGITKSTREPELLAKYLRGKKWRDWHISEYAKGLKERTIFPQEVRAELGHSAKILIRNSFLPKRWEDVLKTTVPGGIVVA